MQTYAVGKSQQFPVGVTFGVKAPKGLTVEGFADDKNPFVPPKKPYVFRKDQLRDALAFLERPAATGCTSLARPGQASPPSSARPPRGSTGRCRKSTAIAGSSSPT